MTDDEELDNQDEEEQGQESSDQQKPNIPSNKKGWKVKKVTDQSGNDVTEEYNQKQKESIDQIRAGQQAAADRSQQGEAALDFWRQHHNDPAYKQIAEQHAEQQKRIEEMKFKAQYDAQTFEKRYTTKQKAEMARLNAAEEQVRNSPEWDSPDDSMRKNALHMIQMKKMGFLPSEQPKLMPYPAGQSVGEVWQAGGGLVTRDKDGRVQRVMRPAETIEGMHVSSKLKMDNDQLKRDAKNHEMMQKFREKHLMVDTFDKFGVKTGTRPRDPKELDSMTRIWMGKQKDGDGVQQTQAAPATPTASEALPQGNSQQTEQASQQQAAPKSQVSGMKIVNSDEEYDALSSGEEFTDSKGRVWRKP